MGPITVSRNVGAFVAALVALTLVGSLGAEAKNNARPSGGKGVAHRDGKAVSAGPVPTAVTYSVGHHALEPTLGVDPGGPSLR